MSCLMKVFPFLYTLFSLDEKIKRFPHNCDYRKENETYSLVLPEIKENLKGRLISCNLFDVTNINMKLTRANVSKVYLFV